MTVRVTLVQVEEALGRVPGHELPLLKRQIAALGAATMPTTAGGRNPYLDLLRREDASDPLKVAVGLARSCVTPTANLAADERRGWITRIEARMRAGIPSAGASPSVATRVNAAPVLMPDLANGRFVQLAHETLLGRGCQPAELVRWRDRLERGEITREGLLEALAEEARRVAERDAARRADPETGFHVMGTGQRITTQDWQARAAALAREPARPAHPARPAVASGLRPGGPPRVRISAITSLYAGGEHIERFLANMVEQTVFADHTELIIVDANSPDGEKEVIARYQQRWPNIRYLRTRERIGIYEAWNLAVEMARGDFLTSANVDDLRRADSLELQATLLERLPFVDVTYQDFFYTLDPTLSFADAAAFGFHSDLPLITPHGLMTLNPPHNAPMWRRSLHDELGLFDTSLQSAGDYDFWMRAVLAGKTFWKSNDPHIVYFQNPRGISTRADTRGHEETREVHWRYGRQLVSENLVLPVAQFRSRCGLDGAPPDLLLDPTDRHAIAHRALLNCASSTPWTSHGTVAPATARSPLRLLIDGIGFAAADAPAPAWAPLAAELAADSQIELWWLDRGGSERTPLPAAMRRIPFPRHRRGACAADSLLIQKVCDLHEIDVFVSTGSTTPVATPALGLVDSTQPGAASALADNDALARRERELAWAFPRRFVCTSPSALGELRRRRPALAAIGARVAEGTASARAVAALLRESGHELRSDHERGAFDEFFAEWRRLRELQASVDV